MYHKLGRPKRTTRAEIISIQEPGCEPAFYRFDNKGNLISLNEMSNKLKTINITMVSVNAPDHIVEKSDTDEKENSNNNFTDASKKEMEIKCEDLSDINYYLNKKPFPSLIDFEPDPLFIAQIQPLLVS